MCLLDTVLALRTPLNSILVQDHQVDPVIQPNIRRRLRATPVNKVSVIDAAVATDNAPGIARTQT